MPKQNLLVPFRSNEAGRPGRIEFFRREAGGYSIRYDTTEPNGNAHTFIGAIIAEEDMDELIRFHASHAVKIDPVS